MPHIFTKLKVIQFPKNLKNLNLKILNLKTTFSYFLAQQSPSCHLRHILPTRFTDLLPVTALSAYLPSYTGRRVFRSEFANAKFVVLLPTNLATVSYTSWCHSHNISITPRSYSSILIICVSTLDHLLLIVNPKTFFFLLFVSSLPLSVRSISY